jgi:exosortase A-associated hydrolase 1
MNERALNFDCAGDSLLGVLSLPPQPADVGVLIVVGGPQYRAGSHRQFVQLARALAAQGIASLRFDTRGMGDSQGRFSSFEQLGPDIAAAIDALLVEAPAVKRVVLWGLCDGASAALLYLHDRPDPRVVGLALANPWVRSDQTHAKTQVKHYYAQRLMDPSFWRKLLSGGVALRGLSELWRALKASRGAPAAPGQRSAASYQDRMAQAWARFDGPLLLILSGNDYTAKEFIELCNSQAQWRSNRARSSVSTLELPEADHTFSQAHARRLSEDGMLQWLRTNGWTSA